MAARVERAGVTGIDLPLRLPGGGRFIIEAAEVVLTFDGHRLARLALELELPFAVYRTVDEQQLFHLEPEARGQSFQPLDPGAPVKLEIELASALVARLAAEG